MISLIQYIAFAFAYAFFAPRDCWIESIFTQLLVKMQAFIIFSPPLSHHHLFFHSSMLIVIILKVIRNWISLYPSKINNTVLWIKLLSIDDTTDFKSKNGAVPDCHVTLMEIFIHLPSFLRLHLLRVTTNLFIFCLLFFVISGTQQPL